MDVIAKFFLIAFSLAMSIIIIMFAMKNQKIKNYLKSFWKHYLLRKPKLILTIILTVVVYIWVDAIINNISNEFSGYGITRTLAETREGVFVLFIKPIFVYISGLIIIKNI